MVLWLCVAYFFSSDSSVSNFIRNLDLHKRPSLHCLLGILVAVGIACVDWYGAERGWTSGRGNGGGFREVGGFQFLLYVIIGVCVGPIAEEVVLRGFLYRAFRGSYGVVMSTIPILAISAWFHWGEVTNSLWTPACLVSLWVMLCIIRERTRNIWNCVLCHAAYNSALMLFWLY
jgi:membrane protease YdiL (CAAX protease family)